MFNPHFSELCFDKECARCEPDNQPVTGDGDNPLKEITIDLPTPTPETIPEYMEWIKFRTASLGRWVRMNEMGTAPVILETIARIEGDLQQLRHLVKGEKDTSDRTDEVLSHLAAVSIEALDKIRDAK